jgi:uncharacterized cupredoxin-like copper-binding protein
MKRSVRLLFAAGVAVLALALAFALAACGDDENDGNGEAPTATEAAALPTSTQEAGQTPEATEEGTTVGISLNEWTITAEGGGALSTVQAGEVLFEVHNDGAVPHELVIIKTDTDPATFTASGGKVDEEGVGELIGEVEEFPGGATETGTFGLQPGTYALICNVAGHYEQGMYASLIVE